jgi:SSS family solute:Na+ symporter
VYCMRGGAEAVVWTEVVQSVVLLGSALLSLGIMVAGVEGGLGGVVAIGREHQKFHMLNWTWDPTVAAVWVVVVGSLFNNLIPYTADQAVIQRYMTTRDERAAARSIWSNAILTLVATALFFGLGSALFAFYRTHPSLLDPALPADGIFPSFMAQRLPSGLLGLVVAGLLSASMSGGVNAIATVLTTDVYRRFRPGAPDARYLRIAVWLTGVLGVLATAMALLLAEFNVRSAWDTFLEILGLFGGSLAGLFALGIFTRRAHGPGALAGAAAGVAATWAVQSLTPVSFFLYGGTGIVTCFGVGYVASLVLPSRPRDLTGLTLHTGGRVRSGMWRPLETP